MKQFTRKCLCFFLAALLAGSLFGCVTAGEDPAVTTDSYILDNTPLIPVTTEGTEPSEPTQGSVPPESTDPSEPATPPETTIPPETADPPVTTTPPVTTAPPEATDTPVETEPPATTVPPVTTPPATTPPATTTPPEKDPVQGGLENEADKLPSSGVAIPDSVIPKASGTLVKSNEEVIIDYSNTADGYVMVKYTAATSQRLKAQVKGPSTTYTFNLTPGVWETFPLSDENGSYKITVFKNVVDTKYATVLSLTTQVTLKDAFAPFLHSNQFVNIAAAPKTAAKAAELCNGLSTLDKVTAVYNFVVKNMRYDYNMAATVQSGYVPDLDVVLGKMTGICFDYASLMTGMLRCQGVPCKLVVGYAGSAYHAWISVWSEGTGWIEGLVFFDGVSWQRMDPTFAASGTSSDYINNGANYTTKYLY